jgi:RNA polymerase sigma-70 factor (ECF subfamily)
MNCSPNSFVSEIAARYGDDLLRFLSRRVASAADTRDLAQEAYVRLLRIEHKELISNPQAYLYRVAAHLVYEFELKRRSDAAGLRRWSEEGMEADEPMAVDRAADAMVLRRRLGAAFKGLSPKCQAVLVMHRRDGMTYEEIGARLGISPSMVKKYLGIGLRHCRSRLRDLEA